MNETLEMCSFYICTRITIGPFWKLHFNYVSLGKGQKDLGGKCEIAYTIHYISIQEERVLICQSAPRHSIIVESPGYCQTRKLEESRGLTWSTLKRAEPHSWQVR